MPLMFTRFAPIPTTNDVLSLSAVQLPNTCPYTALVSVLLQSAVQLRVRPGQLLVVSRQFHGSSVIHDKTPKLNGLKIIREMVRHVWPRDRPWLKVRVVTALGLLVGAKVGSFCRAYIDRSCVCVCVIV